MGKSKVILSRWRYKLRRYIRANVFPGLAIVILLAIAAFCAVKISATPQSQAQEAAPPRPQGLTAPSRPETPQKSNRDKAQADAAELAATAGQLRDELQKLNVNVFSLGAVRETEAIEKLAKKIKAEGNAR
jgi:hypothetical protein